MVSPHRKGKRWVVVSVFYDQNGLLVSLLWLEWILVSVMVKMDCRCLCYGQNGLLVSLLWS